MERHYFHHAGLRFSYVLWGCEAGNVVVALHAHVMEATTFAPLATAITPGWRLVALDQRGHGYSDRALSYTREDYIGDLEALVEHLGLERAVFLGNSVGGVNAYQFAARHSDKVRGLIIEDIGAEVHDDVSFVLAWEGLFATRELLAERVGARFLPYLQASFRETPEGWKLAFDPHDIVASQKCLVGDHWPDWLATNCPALLIRGKESRVTAQAAAELMASRRPNTRLCTVDGGHVIHVENPTGFANTVNEFLNSL